MLDVSYNLSELFERVVDAVPDRVAIVAAERPTSPTPSSTSGPTGWPTTWPRPGIGAGDHVGLQLLNGTEYLEGMLAAFKLRAVPVNVNYRYVERELEHLFDDADLVALVVHRAVRPGRGARWPPSVADAPPRRRRRRRHAAPTVPDGASTTRRRWPPPSPARDFDGPQRRRPATSSTPAAPPACPRACCGATRTSSSRRSAAATPRTIKGPITDARPARRAASPSSPMAQLVHPAAHARERALGGVQHVLRRRQGRAASARAASTRRRGAGELVERTRA